MPEGLRALLAERRIPVSPGGLLGWVHNTDAVTATVAATPACANYREGVDAMARGVAAGQRV